MTAGWGPGATGRETGCPVGGELQRGEPRGHRGPKARGIWDLAGRGSFSQRAPISLPPCTPSSPERLQPPRDGRPRPTAVHLTQ